jgi:hypothetical protein
MGGRWSGPISRLATHAAPVDCLEINSLQAHFQATIPLSSSADGVIDFHNAQGAKAIIEMAKSAEYSFE